VTHPHATGGLVARLTDRTRVMSERGLASAGLGPGGTRTLYVLGLLAAIKALSLVMLAESVARGIVGVIAGNDTWTVWLWVGLAAGVLRGIAHWATQAFAAREALGVKESTRQDLADKLVGDGSGSVGSMTSLATQGLDELDKYYSVVLPAIMSAAVIPLLIGVRILFADWVSALIVVLTIPLVPVFMALIGMHTQERVSAASASLGRLSDNLVELARGLPVLVGLGRVEEQTAALRTISNNYRLRTMETLRTAFLSSLALELISTISVAVVAVFIGVRLVNGSLPLEIGLIALILAPECYAPFRDLGASFHAAQDGVLSLRRARAVVDAPSPEPFLTPGAVSASAGPDSSSAGAVSSSAGAVSSSRGADIAVEALTVRYAGRGDAAVDGLSFGIPAGQITAICGASGSGKSTVLAVLSGRLRDGTDDALVAGVVRGVDPSAIAWVPQHPHTVGDTVRQELARYAATAAADARIDQLLDQLRLTHTIESDPAQLSPGELRRVAVARALLRVDAGATLLLLDEPTAHVDPVSARIIEETIASLRGRVTVVLASHEAEVTALASVRIELDESRAWTAPSSAGTGHGAAGAAGAAGVAGVAAAAAVRPAADGEPATSTDRISSGPGAAVADATTAPAPVSALRLVLQVLRPAGWRFFFAVILGVLAALAAVSLTAVSGWLIVKASTQPSMMYLMVAIVGVRFFGVARSSIRYAERLVTHDGIFAAVTELRVRIWRSLAERGTSSRKLLRGGTALDYLIVTADAVRDLAPRVLIPPVTAMLTAVASVIAVALLHAEAVPLLVASLLLCLVMAPALSLWGDRRASRGQQLIRSEVARRFAALLAAGADLRINNVDAGERAGLRALDARAGVDARRSAWALGLGGSLIVAISCITSVLMVVVAAPAVADGSLSGEVLAVLVLLPLGLLEPMLGGVDAVQQWPNLAQAVRRLEPFTPTDAPSAVGEGIPDDVDAIALRRVSAQWPDSSTPVFEGLTARVAAGEWLIVSGPSGSGKSTLLTVLLGYLHPTSGQYLVDGLDSRILDGAALRKHIAWAPQEGHLFDSTLRANLLLARSHEDAPDEDEMFDALARVGLADFVSALPRGLDTRVGSEGAELSGGQRQRVAVARTLLTRAEVVLLDEPTAHLDGEAAHRMMDDLRFALADKVAVLVTHHLADHRVGDRVLELGVPASDDGADSVRTRMSAAASA
jgi:ATP-binding cassette subfamily C protein CydCD